MLKMADTFQKYLHLFATLLFTVMLSLLSLKFFWNKSYFQWVPGITTIILAILFIAYYTYVGVTRYFFDGEYEINDVTSGLGIAAGLLTLWVGMLLVTDHVIGGFTGYTAGVASVFALILMIPKLFKDIVHIFKD